MQDLHSINLRSILLPHDFSAASDAALPYARSVAEMTGAHLHLLHAEVLYDSDSRDEPSLDPHMLALLDRLPADQVTRAYLRGIAPASAILEYAAEHEIDLIVMGTHGRRGVRRFILGSVAREVVQCAAAPVLTVRPPSSDAQMSPSGTVRHILVPVDFSEHSLVAVSQAKILAAKFGARLSLLHVIEEVLHPAFYNAGAFSIYDLQPDIEQRVGRFLRELFDRAEGPDTSFHSYVKPGRADITIVEMARRLSCDLILMPTHGLRGLEHMVMGSVAERVVRTAPCPVLTIKGNGRVLKMTEDGETARVVEL